MLMIQNFNLLEDCGPPPALTPVAVDTNFYAKPRRWCSRRQWCGCNLWPPRPLTPKSPIAKSSMTKSQEKNPFGPGPSPRQNWIRIFKKSSLIQTLVMMSYNID